MGFYIGMALVCMFAGIGVKWAVDRMFGAQIQMIMPPRHAAPPEKTPARRVLEFDDTMDVLASGIDVGKQIMAAHPVSAAEPAAGGTWEPRPQMALPVPVGAGPGVCAGADGYKLSGPCTLSAAPEQLPAGGSA